MKCLEAGIASVYFTSKFVEKHFKKNFPDINVTTIRLLSPSPAINRYIVGLKEYKEFKIQKENFTPFDFKLIKYKEAFSLNDN
jgi:hypothetical protein